jgi:hypothetical protein
LTEQLQHRCKFGCRISDSHDWRRWIGERSGKIFIEWGLEDGCWKPETKFLAKEGIKHLLGAPQVIDLGDGRKKKQSLLSVGITMDISGSIV